MIQDVVTKKIVQRIDLPTVNEPESPCFSPDGKSIVFSALQNAKSDIFMVTVATGQVTNLTQDQFYNYGPVFSPDGQSVVYLARVSGNEKLFRFDLASEEEDADHLRDPRRHVGALPGREHASCSRPRRSTPRRRSTRRWRATRTSTTSGRWT